MDNWNTHKIERNQEIHRRRQNGERLKELGEEFGITKERVRQIAFLMERKARRVAEASVILKNSEKL